MLTNRPATTLYDNGDVGLTFAVNFARYLGYYMTGFRRSRSPWQRCNAFSITVRLFWLHAHWTPVINRRASHVTASPAVTGTQPHRLQSSNRDLFINSCNLLAMQPQNGRIRMKYYGWTKVHWPCEFTHDLYIVNSADPEQLQRLRSSSCHHLVVPRHRRSTLGRRAFSVALPDDLQDPLLSADNFRKTLKTHLFRNALGHLVVVVVVMYLYSASRSASNALIVP